jgi:hypothetical protein
VTALMAVKTSNGRASGEGRGQEEGVLNEHFGERERSEGLARERKTTFE